MLDRTGAIVTRVADPAFLQHAAMSPDGSQVAVLKVDSETGNEDIWIYEIATGRGRALTSDEPREMTPVWSADGRSIAFVSVRDNTYGVYRRAVDGSGAEERLYLHNNGGNDLPHRLVGGWTAADVLGNERMYVMPLTGDRTPAELPNARGGRFSPDGRLLAFNAPRRSRRAGSTPTSCGSIPRRRRAWRRH